ncbi:MAG: 50S ribosomal protein L15 [Lentisphaerae bacterium]|nr:50S ribosomal protein L15 [Lentisphaerota bacterium]MCP4102096.1 50S ribosomal protein L15 [Lentisphaerota bacterium]
MKLHDLKVAEGSKHRRRRVGRGDSSGLGHTCGRGHKGQKSRSGATIRPFFEGGQIPLFRRLPKRGFKSFNRKMFNVVNLSALEKNFEAGDVVDSEVLHSKGIIGKNDYALKVLANGEITKAITVKACKFSESAKAAIEAAGGKCEVI